MLAWGKMGDSRDTLPLTDALCQAGGRSWVNPAPAKPGWVSSQIHLVSRTVITLLKRLNRSYLSIQILALSPPSRYSTCSLSAALHCKGTGIDLLSYRKVI